MVTSALTVVGIVLVPLLVTNALTVVIPFVAVAALVGRMSWDFAYLA